MLATWLIVFREVLEAALIVSIVMAAARGLPRRGLRIGLGVAAGLLAAAAVALFAREISMAAAGLGQEMFNAGVLFLAVLMLGWHNVWMSRHARDLSRQMADLGRALVAGRRPYYVLSVVTGLAVLREGSEVVLFLYGIAASDVGQSVPMLAGGLLGVGTGVLVGVGLYLGMLQIPTRYVFSVTGWLILLVAAGMASQGASYLAQAGLLPSPWGAVWDSSALLSERSVVGKMLHVLIGYVDQPTGLQLIAYTLTIAVISGLMWFYGGNPALRRAAADSRA